MRSPATRSAKLRRSLLALVATVALFAAGCGGSSADTAAVASEPDSASDAAPSEVAEVPAEASLVANTVSGAQIDFGALEGQDVVLWFWAPW